MSQKQLNVYSQQRLYVLNAQKGRNSENREGGGIERGRGMEVVGKMRELNMWLLKMRKERGERVSGLFFLQWCNEMFPGAVFTGVLLAFRLNDQGFQNIPMCIFNVNFN